MGAWVDGQRRIVWVQRLLEVLGLRGPVVFLVARQLVIIPEDAVLALTGYGRIRSLYKRSFLVLLGRSCVYIQSSDQATEFFIS